MDENHHTKTRIPTSPATLASVIGVLPNVNQGVFIQAYTVVQSQCMRYLQNSDGAANNMPPRWRALERGELLAGRSVISRWICGGPRYNRSP